MRGFRASSEEDMAIPVIDFQGLESGADRAQSDLRRAVRETGFMVVKNTPIEVATVENLLAQYRWFFAQDQSDKQAFDMAQTGSNRGWGCSGAEQVNPEANPDYKEVFDVGIELESGSPYAEQVYYAPNLWPPQNGFRGAVLDYYRLSFEFSLKLLGFIAKAADLPHDFFDDKFDPPMALLRANYYPPRPDGAGESDFGIAAHTDYGCLTLLAIDGVSGLEVQVKDGDWVAVDASPGSFVINFGEMLELWSAGKIRATLHRVIGTKEERISVPFFFNPASDTNIAPIGSGAPILAGEYLSKRYDETYVHRQKATS